MSDEALSVLNPKPINDLFDAALIAFARLFVIERIEHERRNPDVTSTVILSKDLLVLQSAIRALFEGTDTEFIALLLGAVSVQNPSLE